MYMRVIKRSGRIEDMKFDNVTNRIKNLTSGLSENCDSTKVAQQVFSSMYDNITAQEIDILSAEICVGMITADPDYEILATRIIASNIHKVCPNNFHLAMRKLQKTGIVTDEVVEVAQQVKENIKNDRDFDFGYFGLKTLEKSYLQRVEGKLIETPNTCSCVLLLVSMVKISPPFSKRMIKCPKVFSFMPPPPSSMRVPQTSNVFLFPYCKQRGFD